MSAPNYRVRRATLDDLDTLKALWEAMRIYEPDLEKRLTEFHITENQDGQMLGALALQINGKHGRVHGEAFTDFALADELRPLLWARIQALALNHGLVRFWTQEHAPFWKQCGLLPADAGTLEKLPPVWVNATSNWLTLQLRDETAVSSVDKEFAAFMEAEKRRTAKVMHHTKTLKTVVTVIAVILAVFVIAFAFRLLFKNPQLLGR